MPTRGERVHLKTTCLFATVLTFLFALPARADQLRITNYESRALTPPCSLQQVYRSQADTADQHWGHAVSGLGDVNNDGVPDFIIGVHAADPNGIAEAGEVIVFSGATNLPLYQVAGADTGNEFGSTLAAVGDLNGDGKPDFVAAAPSAERFGALSAGTAGLYSGVNGALIRSFVGDSADNQSGLPTQFGFSAANAGDVNNDGKNDIIIGAPFADPGGSADAGAAYVFSGTTGARLFKFTGPQAGVWFGNSVAGLGDITGDGKSEFAVGAPFTGTDSGAVFVYSGTGTLLYIKKGQAGDQLGWSLAKAGDIDGDGKADLIAGAPFSDIGVTNGGGAFVLSGPTGNVIRQLPGLVTNGFAGYSVCGLADFDGDAIPDLAVGAILDPTGGVFNAGRVSVYSGATGELLYERIGDAVIRELGYSVADAGDLNADGKSELLTGTPSARPNNQPFAGVAFVFTAPPFRGDVTGDAVHDISDIVALVRFVVFGDPVAVPNAADANCDGVTDIVDIVGLVQFVVFGSPKPCCL